jgi:ADP-ribose pyrophosphatase YjhB (NUDIX family)
MRAGPPAQRGGAEDSARGGDDAARDAGGDAQDDRSPAANGPHEPHDHDPAHHHNHAARGAADGHRDPKLAAGVVVEHEGRVLLVRRNHEPMYGRWTFPSGFVDAGEVVEEAARREVREEAGVDVRIDRLLGVYSTAGEPVVFVAYAGSTIAGTPVAGEEALEVGLFAPDALPELAFEHDPAIIEAWRAGRGSATRPPAR